MEKASAVSRSVLFFLFLTGPLLLNGCLHSGPDIPRSANPESPSIWPVYPAPRPVISRFGEKRGARVHRGIDLRLEKGSPVVATADGTVTFSGRQHGYGRVVILHHGDNTETVYAHLKKCRVKAGAKVRQGKVIGRSGASGNATTSHLHYEVRRSGKAVNPEDWLP